MTAAGGEELVEVFEGFTDRARQAVVLAQEEARMLNHNNLGTEHILLGLIHEGEGVAARALESLGISLEAARQQVAEIIGQGQQAPSGPIPFTPRAKKVMELALRETTELGHNYIGTEHILLSLIREGEGEGEAAQVLAQLGADRQRVRQQVVELLYPSGRGERLWSPPGRPADTELIPPVAAPAWKAATTPCQSSADAGHRHGPGLMIRDLPRSCRTCRRVGGSCWSACSRAAARTNELDADECHRQTSGG